MRKLKITVHEERIFLVMPLFTCSIPKIIEPQYLRFQPLQKWNERKEKEKTRHHPKNETTPEIRISIDINQDARRDHKFRKQQQIGKIKFEKANHGVT